MFLTRNMTSARSKSSLGISFLLWALFILASSGQSEAAVWHTIRDFFLPRRTCTSTECNDAAKRVINGLNAAVNPCEDFYEFSCGGWIAANPVPENKTKYSRVEKAVTLTQTRVKGILEKEDHEDDTEAIKMARKVYRTCLATDEHAEENMRVLLNRLAVFGDWPIATATWDEKKLDWQKLLSNLIRTNDIYPIFAISVQIDRGNSTGSPIIDIDQGMLNFCYDMATSKNKEAMARYIINIAREIAKAANQTVPRTLMERDAKSIIDTQYAFCESLKGITDRQNQFSQYNPKTLKNLQNFTDSSPTRTKVEWVSLLRDIFPNSSVEINEDFRVVVSEPEYILKVLSIMDNTTSRDIANFMLWQKLAYLHGDISENFRKIGFKYAEETTGVTGFEPRWKTCAQFTNSNMGHAVGYEYVKLHFSEDEKKKALELIRFIVDSFIEDLQQIDWMERQTKLLAIEKAEHMVLAVGYPDWYNKTNVNEYYKDFVAGNSHLINMENLKICDHLRATKMLGKPMDPKMAMNYGGIGMGIGHEMSHAFDVAGRTADKHGNLVEWWDNTTLNKYMAKKACVEAQYTEYPLPNTVTDEDNEIMSLDGLGTVSENIADIGGLKQAYNAYKRYVDEHGSEKRLPGLENYTPEQLFFVGFATTWCETSTPQSIILDIQRDLHSPKKYRVLIPLGNLREFSDTWQCSDTDSKVTKKCSFW